MPNTALIIVMSQFRREFCVFRQAVDTIATSRVDGGAFRSDRFRLLVPPKPHDRAEGILQEISSMRFPGTVPLPFFFFSSFSQIINVFAVGGVYNTGGL